MDLYYVRFRYRARYKLKKNLRVIWNNFLFKIFKSYWFCGKYKNYYQETYSIPGTYRYILANSEDEAKEIAYTKEENYEYLKNAKDSMYVDKLVGFNECALYKHIETDYDKIWIEATKINLPISGQAFVDIAKRIDKKYFHDFLRLCVEYKNKEGDR